MIQDATNRFETPATSVERRYCPLEEGETVGLDECTLCVYRPTPPFRICAPPRATRPRRRGFWDVDPALED